MQPIPSEPVRANVEVSAVTALEPSSISNSGSSSDLSPQSPHSTISISNSPTVSDQSLSIEASHALTSTASAGARPRFLPKAQAMQSLQESIPHAMILQQLKKSEKGHEKDASTNKKQVRRLSKEIYMIVSMYALFQGVLFVAVAQSNAFTCGDRWGPVGIAGGVTIGTLWGVVDKLRRMGLHKQKAKKSKKCQGAVYSKIELLYSCGSGCPIDHNLEPQKARDSPYSRALLCRGLLVLGFLVGFSLLIIASCTCMLCHSNSH